MQGLQDEHPFSLSIPSIVALGDAGPRTKAFGDLSPRSSSIDNADDCFDELPRLGHLLSGLKAERDQLIGRAKALLGMARALVEPVVVHSYVSLLPGDCDGSETTTAEAFTALRTPAGELLPHSKE